MTARARADMAWGMGAAVAPTWLDGIPSDPCPAWCDCPMGIPECDGGGACAHCRAPLAQVRHVYSIGLLGRPALAYCLPCASRLGMVGAATTVQP